MMDEEERIVGYRVTLAVSEYSRLTEVYCAEHAGKLGKHLDRYPIYIHTARQYHISCGECHVPLIEKDLLDRLSEQTHAAQEATRQVKTLEALLTALVLEVSPSLCIP